MRNLIFIVCSVLLSTAFAAVDGVKNKVPEGVKLAGRERIEIAKMKHFGGYVRDTRDQEGKVVVVNAQDSAPGEWIDVVVSDFTNIAKVDIEVSKGSFDLVNPSKMGNATLFVVDNPALPMSLVAPEAAWAMVNVSPLKTDRKMFFEARCKKQLTRGLAYLLGCGDSQYPMSLTGCVTKPEDLDRFTSTKIPVDQVSKFGKYVEGYGIRPFKSVTYRQAVKEGWGPQPTNDYQRVIWEEYHTAPTEPIHIEFDPKKGI